MKHFTLSDLAAEPQRVEKTFANAGVIRLSLADQRALLARLTNLKVNDAGMALVHRRVADTRKGRATRISLSELKGVTATATDGDTDQPIAMTEPVSGTLIVIVLTAALLGGMAAGYLLSDAADEDDGKSVTNITNNGDEDVVINNNNQN